MCYNSTVKKKIVLTTSLCAALAVTACFSGASAFAESTEGIDEYPESFTVAVSFENLTDYAIGDGKYLFIDSGSVFSYDGQVKTKILDETQKAVSLNFKDGNFYYGTRDGAIKTIDGEQAESGALSPERDFTLNQRYHYYTYSGKVYVQDYEAQSPILMNGFKNLKKYNEMAYAVKENTLYEFNGTEYSECVLNYLDYSPTQKINIGDTAEIISSFNIETPHFVSINPGAFMTEVDLSDLDNNFFKTGETVTAGDGVTNETALLLGTTGKDEGISIVTVLIKSTTENGVKSTHKTYLLRSDNTKAIKRTLSISESEHPLSGTVTVSEGYLYSSPVVGNSTQLEKIVSGQLFEICGELQKTSNPELKYDFYLIKYTDDAGTVHKGYLPFEYVSLNTYIEKEPENFVDPDYSEEDLVRPAVLILIVIVLVLIAAGYLVYTGTSGKNKQQNKKTKKNKNNEIIEE